MDAKTLEIINEAHPKIRVKLLAAYKEANNKLGKGVRLRFSKVYRSPQEQEIDYRKKPRVTNAKAWQSFHQYCLAFDIVLLYDKNGDGVFEEASWDVKKDGDKDGLSDWLEVTKVFTDAGFKNGFITKGKKWDLPHFQMDFGYTWQDLKKMISNGNYKEETVNGKVIKYVNI